MTLFERFGNQSEKCRPGKPAGGAVYGLGLIGAAIYFVGHAGSFWLGVLGILKAIVWPALMVYKAFEFLASI
jgi:hypothetical protein